MQFHHLPWKRKVQTFVNYLYDSPRHQISSPSSQGQAAPERGACTHCPLRCTWLQTQWLASYLWGRRMCTVHRHLQLTNLRLEYLLASPPAPASCMHRYPFWTPKLETQSHPQPSHIHPDTNHQPPQQSGICHLLEAPAAVALVQDLSLIWITAKSKPLLRSLLCLLSKSSSMTSLVECSSIASIILLLPNLIPLGSSPWGLPAFASRLVFLHSSPPYVTLIPKLLF